MLLKSAVRAASLAFLCLFAGVAVAQEVKREITRVAGEVYRFQNKFHYSLVTVTGDGVVIVGPINAGAATWLRDNLSTITDNPSPISSTATAIWITHQAARFTSTPVPRLLPRPMHLRPSTV